MIKSQVSGMIRPSRRTITRNLAALVLAAAMGSVASAQDPVLDLSLLWDAPKCADNITLSKVSGPEFGLRAGYIKPRDADDGTWFGGVQVRVPLTEMFALEGSIAFHTSEFADGEIEVVQWPVQATLLVFILPQAASVSPYLLGGLGWYYTTTEFSGSLSALDDDTESMFGAHIGFGARIGLGAASASADLRYIFLEPDGDRLEDEDFDAIQLVLSLSFPF
jgi:hypothetical protein